MAYLYSLMLVKILLYGFLLYLLFKFVYNFLMPLGKATSQMRDKIREMQEGQQQQYQKQQFTAEKQKQEPSEESTAKGDDYIDFEEVK